MFRTASQISIALLGVMFTLAAHTTENSPGENSIRPNIIMILVDDMNKHELSPYGGAVLTPNLQKLASEGMIFHNAYVSSTVCTPSRYSYVSGRHPGRSQYPPYLENFPEDYQGGPDFNVGLETDGMNIGKVLSDNGYVTGWVGKFHMHGVIEEDGERRKIKKLSPEDPGANETMRSIERRTREYIKSLGWTWAKHVYEGNTPKGYSPHNLEWTMEAVLEFIEENHKRPFYLHFTPTLLHGDDHKIRKSLSFPEITGEGVVRREFDAEMPPRDSIEKRIRTAGFDHSVGLTWLDDGVGAITKKLDELGIADNTIVIFVSDHGSLNKGSLYAKDGAAVPLIVRYPNGIKAGSESHSLVQNIDFAPTFFDFTESKAPSEYIMDGRSMRPVFEDSNEKIHDSLFFQIGSARAVLKGNYRYIANRYTASQVKKIQRSEGKILFSKMVYTGGHVNVGVRGMKHNLEYLAYDQLYDLDQDPGEFNNLAGDPEQADKLEKMKLELKNHLLGLGRPYGEFIPGKNTTTPGQVDKQIAMVKEMIKAGAIDTPEDIVNLRKKNLK